MPSENVPSDLVQEGDFRSPISMTFLDYYGLNEQPFGLTPDPSFLYLTPSHREALAALLCGIETGRGLAALIAQPGMGKTTLLFRLLERYRGSARTAFLFRTQCDSSQLLSYLMSDLGINPERQGVVEMHEKLNEILLSEAAAGRRVLVFIDEAHNLEESVLETVRLLSDFERPDAKLIQIVLAGQPSLADKLVPPALRQRVSVRARLDPLIPAEVTHYIDHRLRVAGYTGDSLFTPEAQFLLAARSEGIPRDINNLCFHSLMTGFALSRKAIDVDIVREVLASLYPQHATKGADRVPANILQFAPLGSSPLDTRPPTRDDSDPSGEISLDILESRRIDRHIQEASRRAMELVSRELDEKVNKEVDDASCRVVEETRKRLENEVSAALEVFGKSASDRLHILEEEQLSRSIDRFQAQAAEKVQRQISDLKAALEPYLELRAVADKMESLLNDGELINRLVQARDGAANACQHADTAVKDIALAAEAAMKKLHTAGEEMAAKVACAVDDIRREVDQSLRHSAEQLGKQAEETAETVSIQLRALHRKSIEETNKELAAATQSPLELLTKQAQAITEECCAHLRQTSNEFVLSDARQLEASHRRVEEFVSQSVFKLRAEMTEQFQKQVDGIQSALLQSRCDLKMIADKIAPLVVNAAPVQGQGEDDRHSTEAAVSRINLVATTAVDDLHSLERHLEVNSAAAINALRKATDELIASSTLRLERQTDESAARINQELREMKARSIEEANKQLDAVTQASLQSLTRDAETISQEWRDRLRQESNAAALASVRKLEAEPEKREKDRGPTRGSMDILSSAPSRFRSWPNRFHVGPTTIEAALNATLRAAVWLIPITPALFFVAHSIRPLRDLRSDPPAEFFGERQDGDRMRAEAEERLARAYWRSAIRDIQPKHRFGTNLPEEAPLEFKAEGAGLQSGNPRSDADTRNGYWRRLRQVWAQPQSWEKSYVWDTGWMDSALGFGSKQGAKIGAR